MSDYLDPNNEELLKDFFGEAQSQVDVLEQNVLVLENDPNNKEAVDEIFRAAHTLKGGAGTVQMVELAEFTHVVEDVLDEIRSGSVKMTEDLIDSLLNSIDVIKAMLDQRLAGKVFKEDVQPLKTHLKSFLPGASKVAPAKAKKTLKELATPAKIAKSGSGGLSEYDLLELKEAAGGEKIYQVNISFDESNPMNSVGGIQVFAVLKELGTVLKTAPEFDKLYEDNFFPIVTYYCIFKKEIDVVEKRCHIAEVTTAVEILELKDEGQESAKAKPETPSRAEVKSLPEKMPEEHLAEQTIGVAEDSGSVAVAKEGEHKKSSQSSGSILRVDSKRIDNLLNLVSETVINKATFNQISTHFGEVLSDLQTSSSYYKDKLKDLFERLPEYLEEMEKGKSVKEIKKSINEEFSRLYSVYDPLESKLKSTVGVFRSTSQNLGRIIGELHEGVLRIRMVPIAQIFRVFPASYGTSRKL